MADDVNENTPIQAQAGSPIDQLIRSHSLFPETSAATQEFFRQTVVPKETAVALAVAAVTESQAIMDALDGTVDGIASKEAIMRLGVGLQTTFGEKFGQVVDQEALNENAAHIFADLPEQIQFGDEAAIRGDIETVFNTMDKNGDNWISGAEFMDVGPQAIFESQLPNLIVPNERDLTPQ